MLGGTVRPSYTVVPKGILGYYSGADNPHYSLARAKAELAQCPSRTVPFALKYEHYGSDNINEATAIATMLSQAGLNVRLTGLTPNAWGQTVSHSLDATHTQLLFDGWVQDYPDPQDYCTLLLRSGSPYAVGGWHSSAYDRLVDRADETLNPKQRAALYIQAQHLAISQGAFITINQALSYELIRPSVHGLVTTEAYVDVVAKDLDCANVSQLTKINLELPLVIGMSQIGHSRTYCALDIHPVIVTPETFSRFYALAYARQAVTGIDAHESTAHPGCCACYDIRARNTFP